MKRKGITLSLIVVAVLVVVAYTQLTLFVVPPIGAVPEGNTVVILQLKKTNFIDSPDALCERIQGGVSLLCRGVIMGRVLEKSKIIMRLPYNESLYLISTDGKTYSR